MPRRRLAAALLLPPPWAAEVDGLRRACGDLQLARVAPHITLIPPINVREADLTAVLALVRTAAASVAGPLDLAIGPAATFLPASPVVYLRVDGPAIADGALAAVRASLQAGPLAREDRWPFVPHVTLAQDRPTDRLAATVVALADYAAVVQFDRLHLLEERPGEDGGRRWVPIADAVLGERVVVGRGSLPLELTTGSVIDPEAMLLLPSPDAPEDVDDGATTGQRIVVTARRDETAEPVGVAVGDGREPDPEVVAVTASATGEGVEEHLLARWRWAADRP